MAIVALPGYLAWTQKMPLFVIPLAVLFAAGVGLLFVNQWNSWKRGWGFARFSEKRAEKKIREWIIVPGLRVEPFPKEQNLMFGFFLEDVHKRRITVLREADSPSVLQVGARVTMSPPPRLLTETEWKKMSSEIKIEMARLGIQYSFDGSPNKYDSISLSDLVILDNTLTEFYFKQRIFFVLRAMVLVISIANKTYDEPSLLANPQ